MKGEVCMSIEKSVPNGEKNIPPIEVFAIYLTDGLLYDKLHQFATEYTLPVE